VVSLSKRMEFPLWIYRTSICGNTAQFQDERGPPAAKAEPRIG
jgi:hypothetical protein